MECSIIKKNKEIEIIPIPANIFDVEYNAQLIHQIIVSYIANSHIGIKKQKSRSEVRGGGKKPWKQKGTGRARAGSIRSPLWRGGGKIFARIAVQKRKKKINKKMYNLGIKIILSQLYRDGKITFTDDINLDTHKTKKFLLETNFLTINKNTILFLLPDLDYNVYLSTRNIRQITIAECKKINPFLLLKYNHIIITKSSINKLKECYQ